MLVKKEVPEGLKPQAFFSTKDSSFFSYGLVRVNLSSLWNAISMCYRVVANNLHRESYPLQPVKAGST